METVTQFTAVDGTHHRIGYLAARNNAGQLLVDDWAGHGLRLLALLSTRDTDSEVEVERQNGDSFQSSVSSQADAVIREYRVDACLAERPLSRRVVPAEIADSSRLVTA